MGTPHSALHIVCDDLSALFVREAEKGIRCSPEFAVLETLGMSANGHCGRFYPVRRVDAGRALLAKLAALIPQRESAGGWHGGCQDRRRRRAPLTGVGGLAPRFWCRL